MEPETECNQSSLEKYIPDNSSNVGTNIKKFKDDYQTNHQLLHCLILALIHKVSVS